jgi:hypothetical protein
MNVRMHLLASGRFLMFIAETLLRHNAKRWSLKALPVDLGIQQLPVAIATLRNRTLSPTVLFIEHIRSPARRPLRHMGVAAARTSGVTQTVT